MAATSRLSLNNSTWGSGKRRVGEKGRFRGGPDHLKKKKKREGKGRGIGGRGRSSKKKNKKRNRKYGLTDTRLRRVQTEMYSTTANITVERRVSAETRY